VEELCPVGIGPIGGILPVGAVNHSLIGLQGSVQKNLLKVLVPFVVDPLQLSALVVVDELRAAESLESSSSSAVFIGEFLFDVDAALYGLLEAAHCRGLPHQAGLAGLVIRFERDIWLFFGEAHLF